jgi:hypothetical protein
MMVHRPSGNLLLQPLLVVLLAFLVLLLLLLQDLPRTRNQLNPLPSTPEAPVLPATQTRLKRRFMPAADNPLGHSQQPSTAGQLQLRQRPFMPLARNRLRHPCTLAATHRRVDPRRVLFTPTVRKLAGHPRHYMQQGRGPTQPGLVQMQLNPLQEGRQPVQKNSRLANQCQRLSRCLVIKQWYCRQHYPAREHKHWPQTTDHQLTHSLNL